MGELQEMLIQKRRELNLSLRKAGSLIGISHSYLRALENGIDPRTNTPIKPSPEVLKLISKAYDIDYHRLMKAAGYLDEEENEDSDSVLIPEEYTQKYKVTGRDLKQYEEFIRQASIFFMDDRIADEDKEKLFRDITELFWKSKDINKKKYGRKKKDKTE
ncbi:MAG TPA: helix-turn-helix transcriptional regulator [Thermoclostridium sp.]